MKQDPVIINLDQFTSGIYIFRSKFDGHIIYVGKDSFLDKNKRLKYHSLIKAKKLSVDDAWQDTDDLVYQQLCFSSRDDMDLIEEALISFYLPELNIEYKEQITKQHQSTIEFINYLKRVYNLSKKDLTRLVSIIQLRCL